MSLVIETATTFDPISLTDAKDHLRVSGDTEDHIISKDVRSAVQWCENELNWKLTTQTWKYFLDFFPGDIIRMPFPPLQSITHIKYYDSDNELQELVKDTDYRVDKNSTPARIDPIDGWPSTYDRLSAVEIQFVCGYATATKIVDDIKSAIYLRLSDLFENRQNTQIGGANNAVSNTETSHNILMRYKLYNEVL